MNRFAALALVLIAAVAASSCGGGNGSNRILPSSGRLDLADDKPAFTITFQPGDLQGRASSSIGSGDFNSDGVTDLLLGAPFADPDGSRNDAGEALVLYGPIEGDRDLAKDSPDVRFIGASPGDMLGAAVASGDLNGDGIDDIVLGAPGSNGIPEVRTDMGEAYVIFGGSLPEKMDFREGGYDSILQPAEGFSTLGKTFAIADVNGDGTSDLVAGAPYAGRQEGTPPGSPRTTVGEVYVVYGSSEFPREVRVARAEENVRLSGVASYDQLGVSVAAGDLNGDGVADIVAGASGFDGVAGDKEEAGGVFVFFGGAALKGHRMLSEADVVVGGEDGGDSLGTSLVVSDLDGDGLPEIVSLASSAGGPGNQRFGSGEVVILDLASHSGNGLRSLTAAGGRRVYAPTYGELLSGPVVLSSGDEPRLAIGSTAREIPERPGAGWTYLLKPPVSSDVDIASERSGALQIEGAADQDALGGAIAFADLDGDGKQELLVEATGIEPAPGAAPNFVGRLYVFRLS
jgi:hypothetical protein